MESFAKPKGIKSKIPFGDMSKYNEYIQKAWRDSRQRAFEAWQATKDLILR
ncbi:MAG: hypothetical protein MJ158_02365 [Alphaproteobacteria bacterium]|nr:hypothetical protein [Alphaproteobacteria bacterium]